MNNNARIQRHFALQKKNKNKKSLRVLRKHHLSSITYSHTIMMHYYLISIPHSEQLVYEIISIKRILYQLFSLKKKYYK